MAEPTAHSGPLAPDRTRDRTALLNQLMLAGVVLILTLFVASGPFPGDLGLFFLGVLAVFIVTALTIVVPWNSLPLGWMAVVPGIDLAAIFIMRTSSPPSGFGLLWIFPVIWLATTFGMRGLIAGAIATAMLFAAVVWLDPQHHVAYATLLLPLIVLAVSAASFLTARQSAAQRHLLDKQAQVLAAALERARRQEQEVTEVLNAVDFGVVRIGTDGSTAVTNEAHGRLQSALGGPDAPAAAYQDDGTTPLPLEESPLQRALRGEAFNGQLVWYGDPSGPRQVLSVTARRLTDTAGQDRGAVVVSRDVTPERAALQARDELVASVSHELRTPLTSILGYLDLVLDDESLPADARRQLEIAERNAERLLAIVADILAASRRPHAVTAQLPIRPLDVDIRPVVQAAVESMLPRAAERNVRIDDTGVPSLTAHIDPQRIRQVLDNLLANAVKYNVDGGQVVVTATADGRDVLIAVRDTGVGLEGTDRLRLFQRFYRGSAVRASGMAGTGLGLAISREIARAHGGDITVTTGESGVGSIFTVRVPGAREAAT
jgi:signal transduction histidine kinase